MKRLMSSKGAKTQPKTHFATKPWLSIIRLYPVCKRHYEDERKYTKEDELEVVGLEIFLMWTYVIPALSSHDIY